MTKLAYRSARELLALPFGKAPAAAMDTTLDNVRERFGSTSLTRGVLLLDPSRPASSQLLALIQTTLRTQSAALFDEVSARTYSVGLMTTEVETAARDARYKFFAQIAKRRRCRTIFLGHQADDLVETFLINLFRGAGPGGLSARRGVSIRKIDNVKLQIVRPLLGVSREQIDDYVRKHRLKFREDASNKNLAPLRNRIRHRIIPDIEKQIGRNVRGTIWRAATIAAEEENFFKALLPDKLSKLTALAVKPLRAMPIAVQRRMVHEWLRARDVPDLSFDLIERVRALLDLSNRAAKTNLPQDRHVRRRAGQIFIE